MGVPSEALQQTLNQYNDALKNNKLQELPITRSNLVKPFLVENLPLMAIPICPGITYTMVGIDIDQHAQVLDSQAKPIPGLFAAGATTGGLEGGKDSVYIGGLIKSGSFGLLAAERIATLEGKQVSYEQVTQKEKSESSTPDAQQEAVKTPYGLDRFPILKTTIHHGRKIGVALAVIIFMLTMLLTSHLAIGWQLLFATGLSLTILIVIFGIVELVQLITEFLMPE